jgi:ketosteroid isomerase-like protein
MLLSRRQSAIMGGCALIGAGLLSSTRAFADAADEAAVEQAAQNLRTAMLASDGAALDALVAPEMIYAHSDGHVENKTQYVDTIATKKTIYTSITLSNIKTVVAGDTAVMRLVFDCAYTDAGKPPATAHLGVMETWQKQGGSWKLLGRQAYHI